MQNIGFEGDAAFFGIMANRAIDATDQRELHRVADVYRQLAQDNPLPPKSSRTRADGWRFRAEECRALADQFTNPQCQAQLQRLASTYDRMAASHETTDHLEIFLK